MNAKEKIYALLATARIANVPSACSNLGAGVFLAASGNTWPWLLSLSAILFYISGNFLNDWWDRKWDSTHRPERALPRGLFSANTYLYTAIIGFSSGLLLSSLYGISTLIGSIVLITFILFYTIIHKRTPLSVIPMGICRACLPLLGYLAVSHSLTSEILFPSLALFLYIGSLSISARWESKSAISSKNRIFPAFLLFASGVVAAIPILSDYPEIGWIGLLPFVLWVSLALTKYRSPIPAHVSALLAGIPLIDWIALLPMAFLLLVQKKLTVLEPQFLAILLLSPICFIFGRTLQKIAPAT